MEEKRIALLIDAENTSVKYLPAIFSELKQYGVITYRHMYGDFSTQGLARWNEEARNHAIVPILQPHYSSSKNAADIMLVIDAMDILYKDKVDGFCIVSSDSDFTRLVTRIREEGKIVIGMGTSKKSSKTLITACDKYKFLDKIVDEEMKADKNERQEQSTKTSEKAIKEIPENTSEDEIKKENSITSLSEIKSAINELIQQSESNGEHAHLGSVKSTLQKLYPDFDERNYGYNSMMKFITEATKFEIIKNGSSIHVVCSKRDNPKDTDKKVRQYILQRAETSIELGVLGNNIHEKFPEFKYKDYGYSRLSKYVSSIKGIQISNDKNKNIVSKNS